MTTNWEKIARDMIFSQMLAHPLPWRVEEDWTSEVTAADEYIVAKTDAATAKQIIATAEQIRTELDGAETAFEQEMSFIRTDPEPL